MFTRNTPKNKINTKTKAGLVASYDLRLGNGASRILQLPGPTRGNRPLWGLGALTLFDKNSSGDEIANVNFYAVRPEATQIR